MKITAIELEEIDILYILTTTYESDAIDYWSQSQRVQRLSSSIKEMDTLVNHIDIKEVNENETAFTIPHVIDRDVIIKGVERIVKGEVDAPRIREMILNDDVDSEGADCIVQAGLFGEIKYS